jgi:hypothetical protein
MDFSFILCAHTSSGAHPASCLMGTGGPFPGGKTRPGRDADHSPHLVPRSRMSRGYISSPPWRLHGDNGTDFTVTSVQNVTHRLRITCLKLVTDSVQSKNFYDKSYFISEDSLPSRTLSCTWFVVTRNTRIAWWCRNGHVARKL